MLRRKSTNIRKDLKKPAIKSVYKKCFYRSFDVQNHSKRDDFWVILDRRVLNLSNLLKSMDEIPNSVNNLLALQQLNMFGGTDVSELFVRRPENKLEMFDLKSNSDYGKANDLFWWNDPACVIGGITTQERHLCVKNKAKGTQCHLTVCEEDSIYEIRSKFFNAYPDDNSENIVWRKTESTCCPNGHLKLDKTLAGNGLPWDSKEEVVYLWMFHKDELNICPGFM